MLEIGTVLGGRYRILDVLGQGGMSTVYLAVNDRANKKWAIKAIRREGDMGRSAEGQVFIRELTILRELEHPAVPEIVDVIEHEDETLIVMDYVPGHTLDQIVRQQGPLPRELVVDLGIRLCEVLDYLHSRESPILYLDMKPSNILWEPSIKGGKTGRMVLIDFGTACYLRQKKSGIWGTYGFAAPEQRAGRLDEIDIPTDIYNLGATLKFLLTGNCTNECKLSGNPEDELVRILAKCMQTAPEDRYPDCRELRYALKTIRLQAKQDGRIIGVKSDLFFVKRRNSHLKKNQKKNRCVGGGKKNNRCLRGLVFVCSLCLGLAVVTGLTFMSRMRDMEYDSQDAYSPVRNCVNEILADPIHEEKYLEYVHLLTEDQVLSIEEGQLIEELKLMKVVRSPKRIIRRQDLLSRLEQENPKGYEMVCTEVGRAYLYYYDASGMTDRYELARGWFRRIEDCNGEARNYDRIAEGLRRIEEYGLRYSETGTDRIILSNSLREELTVLIEHCREIADPTVEDLTWQMIGQIMEDDLGILLETLPAEEVREYAEEIERECKGTECRRQIHRVTERLRNLES